MKTVMRGNKQLSISDERLEGYKTLGYVEIDPETGAPLAPPDNAKAETEALKKENTALKKANAELAAKIKAGEGKDPKDPKDPKDGEGKDPK